MAAPRDPRSRLWRGLTEPHPDLVGAERSRAQLLAAVLLFVMPLAVVASLATPVLEPERAPFPSPATLTGLGVAVSLAVIYGLARTRHARLAARLVVVVASAAVLFASWVNRFAEDRTVSLYFLGAGVLLSSLFLSLRATTFVMVALLVATALLPVFAPEFTPIDVVQPTIFLAIVSSLVLVHAWLRERDEARLAAKERALSESEDRYRTLFSSTFEGILVHADGVVIEANPAVDDLLGVGPDEVRGRPVASFLPDGVARAADARAHEVALRRADGTEVPVEISTKATQIGGRAVFVTAVHDVSQRKKAEEERLASMARLDEIERLKAVDKFRTEFINVAAHELATPLTPIRLQLHILERDAEGLPEPTRRALGLVTRNVVRLSALVADLLETARQQSQTVRLDLATVDVNALAMEVLETFESNAEQGRVKLASRLEPGATVTADARRVSQVLFNLVANALKYTPEEGEVVVNTRKVGSRVRVEVTDTGAGMTEAQISRLFRPFAKVHEGTAGAQPGTGLGLYICKGIVELHEGTIGATSAGPGKGTTFWFELPRDRDTRALVPHEGGRARDAEPTRKRG